MAAENVKSAPSRFLQRPQRWIVGLLLMGMAVVLLNRKYVPYWLRPEFYEMEAAQRDAFVQWTKTRIDVQQRPLLMIGDSMALGCDWLDTDVLALPGGNPAQVLEWAGENLTDHHYQYAIVWIGTAGASPILDEIPRLRKLLGDRSDRLVVIAPMPNDAPPNWFPEESQWITLPPRDQQKLVRQLRERLPNAIVVDPAPLIHATVNTTDGLHLSSDGFAELRAMLDELLAS